MENISTKPMENTPPRKMSRGHLMAQAGLRALGIKATLVAIVLMTTSREAISLFGFQIEAKYSYSPPLKFYVGVHSVACFLSVVSLSTFVYCARLANPSQKMHSIMFLLDLTVMLLVVTGSSAATAIGYVGRYGDDHAGWMPICDHFHKFCNKSMASLIMSYLAGMVSVLLTIWSSRKASARSTR